MRQSKPYCSKPRRCRLLGHRRAIKVDTSETITPLFSIDSPQTLAIKSSPKSKGMNNLHLVNFQYHLGIASFTK